MSRKKRIHSTEARVGETVRLILDVPVVRVIGSGGMHGVRIGRDEVTFADVDRVGGVILRTPGFDWKPGDVVVIRFGGPDSQPYTYVRGSRDWPGETTPLSDDEVTARVRAGHGKHVLRDGEPVTALLGTPKAPSPAPTPIRPRPPIRPTRPFPYV